MCNIAVIEFLMDNIKIDEFSGSMVLEVGSKCINGSIRPIIEKFYHPKKYIGVDLERGKFVDVVLSAEKIVEYFGPESFDVVITTELLEHVQDWRLVVNNMKKVLRPQGYMYVTTRSRGFPYHGYPYDFWRYEIEDINKIFEDFKILTLYKDQDAPGVLLKALKPNNYISIDLSKIALYSIFLGKRTTDIPDLKDIPLTRKLIFKFWSSKTKWILERPIRRIKYLFDIWS